MDKNAIKKYAVWARRELISRVSQRAALYDITEKNPGDPAADSVHGQVLTASEKKERQALIAQIKIKGYEEVMEEVAYTWFNRFSALRFMEVNGYLPSHVRVFTDDNNAFKPQILAEAINLDLDGLDMEKVYALKNENKTDELFKYLVIVQCNALSSILPGMFQKIEDYTELLFPDNLLRNGSAIEQMIALIPEEDWKDQVQIIGWLYQYYNSEKKDDVFAALKKNVKITKENIPAATQLFTPDWIVRYMVENSLGRLWVEGHPNDELKTRWKYYLEEAEQEPEVQTKLAEIRKEYAALKPEDLKCIDPCSGSGHILAYMFDVLVQIYEAQGYTTRDAVRSIVENNIYGLDIDDRAAQLAYFSVMMKGRQYDSRFFKRGVQPHVYAIVESNNVDKYALEYFCNGDAKLTKAMNTIIKELHDAKEFGSILTVSPQNWHYLYDRFDAIRDDISMHRESALALLPMVQAAEALSQKYHTVITNPPYMGSTGMGSKLSSFVKKNYPNSKSDLFAVFIEKCNYMTFKNGYLSMITQHAFMFLSSYESLREILLTKTIINMAHLGARAFEEIGGEVVQTTSFVLNNIDCQKYKGCYARLTAPTTQKGKETLFLEKSSLFYTQQNSFVQIPTKEFIYWLSKDFLRMFRYPSMNECAYSFQGMITGDNNYFLRLWYENDYTKVITDMEPKESDRFDNVWVPYNKGGGYRKWYGNNEYTLRWINKGASLTRARTENKNFYFREGVTWSFICTSDFSCRYFPNGFLWDVAGSSIFSTGKLSPAFICGLMNSCVASEILKVVNPTINYQVQNILQLPVPQVEEKDICKVENLVEKCICISKEDWDSLETSWDFQESPLVPSNKKHSKDTLIEECFDLWRKTCNERKNKLQNLEEEINSIFINAYGMADEFSPLVEENSLSLMEADLARDIKGLISYAVGCMFGRYSLDEKGIVYAGGNWDDSKYQTFMADKDNIIPVCNDEYFSDDIVSRFIEFIRVVYGNSTLNRNLQYIASALGGNGQPQEVIRNYFCNEFYDDHIKLYQKRPIYWLFDSGKKGGFKCLIYMQRYLPDTIARIRIDYVHEQQSRYRTEIADIETRISNATTTDKVKLNKRLKMLQEQSLEIHDYEEKIHHLADQMVRIDLDNGVKSNYALFKDVLRKI